MQSGEGERLEAQRRRRFWLTIGGLGLAGGLSGFVAGFIMGMKDVAPDAVWATLNPIAAIAVVVFAIFLFSYGCWRFLQAIDEVELADNLWGSTAGYYAYAIIFPSWWVLAKANVTPDPSHWTIFAASLVAGCVAYLWRKWRAR